jgi:hypothetical protein
VLAHLALERLEAALAGHSRDTFLPKAPCDEVEQQYANRGARSGGKGVKQIKIVVPCHQDYYQKVVPEWQEKKRRIKDTQQKRPEVSQMQKEPEELMDETRHGLSSILSNHLVKMKACAAGRCDNVLF